VPTSWDKYHFRRLEINVTQFISEKKPLAAPPSATSTASTTDHGADPGPASENTGDAKPKNVTSGRSGCAPDETPPMRRPSRGQNGVVGVHFSTDPDADANSRPATDTTKISDCPFLLSRLA
jgi:hypothetical protein